MYLNASRRFEKWFVLEPGEVPTSYFHVYRNCDTYVCIENVLDRHQ